jgi:phage terminase large subunit
MIVTAQFPDKLRFLFQPSRYKIARGGRGSAKSWSFARALLIMGAQKKIRVLCAREVQLSIKQSVHKLLKDQVDLLGLSSRYRVLETEIRGKNGTEFSFTGLSTLTADTIKSYEGVDVCWVEEGQAISKRSWDILLPTIRKENSEIWVSYNPDLESDETHQRFTINPPPGTVNVEINWRDNPWFSETLDAERRHCQTYNPDDYDNIWEGKCRPAVEGAIYYKQVQQMEEQGRICDVPYDPLLLVHVVLDLGWADSMSIGMIQKHASALRVIDYIEDSHKTLSDYSDVLRSRPYRWGSVWLPHDGFSKDLKTGLSSAEIMRQLGWHVQPREAIAELSVEEGIKATRLLFPRLYIDKTKCSRLVECLKRYRRHINRTTDTATVPLHDEYSHGADMLRYLCINADQMQNAIGDRPFAPRRDISARRSR